MAYEHKSSFSVFSVTSLHTSIRQCVLFGKIFNCSFCCRLVVGNWQSAINNCEIAY
ncbi:hypothetical protein KsCSTR_24490 [Candidatus Kuenenia stuttgartiensis]|uniref:Uncharacterized protein n=1 Tax=Kuenenia stuttgartiensis TaxID=174633 RepID=Q1Q3X7_KUEST|nr:hypothetical protein KsCSTR_24490 [Candidatus Kuenenia stuttgartiensis]CAJ74718.1 unknown protein [Candidatus Kuenenia stuttgartiensis]